MRQLDLGTGFGQTSITMKYNFQNFRLNLGENNVSKLNHTQVIERPEYPGELSKFQFYQFLINNSDGYVGGTVRLLLPPYTIKLQGNYCSRVT